MILSLIYPWSTLNLQTDLWTTVLMFHTCPHFKGQRNHSGPHKASCASAHKLLTCSHSTPSCCPGLYHALKSTSEPGRETATVCKQACYCGPAAIHSRQTANTHTPLWTVWLKLRGIWFHKLSRACKSARINNVGALRCGLYHFRTLRKSHSFSSGLEQIIVYAEHTRLNVWLLNSDFIPLLTAFRMSSGGGALK